MPHSVVNAERRPVGILVRSIAGLQTADITPTVPNMWGLGKMTLGGTGGPSLSAIAVFRADYLVQPAILRPGRDFSGDSAVGLRLLANRAGAGGQGSVVRKQAACATGGPKEPGNVRQFL